MLLCSDNAVFHELVQSKTQKDVKMNRVYKQTRFNWHESESNIQRRCSSRKCTLRASDREQATSLLVGLHVTKIRLHSTCSQVWSGMQAHGQWTVYSSERFI